MMRRLLAAGALALAATSPAGAASFIMQSSPIAPGGGAIPDNNEFKSHFNDDLGLTWFLQGFVLLLDGPATIKVDYLGAESLYDDTFTLGSFSFTETDTLADHFNAPVNIGQVDITSSLPGYSTGIPGAIVLDGQLAFSGPGECGEIGCFGMGLFLPSLVYHYESNVIYLGYDDQPESSDPLVDDDNHDDMIIRLTAYDLAVPEPATWAMMIAGFGLIGATLRSSRRRLTPTLA